MSDFGLILKNLGRNRLRTLLTVAAIALPMFVFTVARSFKDVVTQLFALSDLKMRVAVHQKLTFTTFIPQRLRAEIEAMAPQGYITAACRTSWFGGKVQDSQFDFPNMGVDRDTFPVVYSDYGMTADEVERFKSERRGAVIAKALADRMNWKLGDRVTLKGSIPPYLTVELLIVAILQDIPGPWLYFGLDYYDEVFKQATDSSIGVNNIWLRMATPQAREWAMTEIDKHFANTEYETRTELESTFIAAFAKSGGDWVGLVWTVGQLIVLVAVMVAFNTMSMAFRERTRELAVLRALGFPAGRISRMVMSEGFLLGLLGGLIAVGPIYALTQLSEIEIPGIPMRVMISTTTAGMAFSVALVCGLLAAVIPAWSAGRLQIATALRKVV